VASPSPSASTPSQRCFDSLELGTRGYAYAFSQDGAIISHPQRDLVRDGHTIFESAWESGDAAMNSAAIDAVRGGRGLTSLVDPATGQATWLAYQPVSATGWSVAVVYFQDSFSPDADLERHAWFQIVALAVFGVGLLGWTANIQLLDRHAAWLWINSWTITAALLVGIVGLWQIDHNRFPP
jgi:signal transduction histidine kinase